MDPIAVLKVLVAIEGMSKATGQLTTLDGTLHATASSADDMGGSLNQAAVKARSMQADVKKATAVAAGLGVSVKNAGADSSAAGDGFTHAADGASQMEADLQRAQASGAEMARALGGLLDDTDNYSAALLTSHGVQGQAASSSDDLRRARDTLAASVGGLLGDEEGLAAALQRSHDIHRDATGATDELTAANQRAASWTKLLGDVQGAQLTDAERLAGTLGLLGGDTDDYATALQRAGGVSQEAISSNEQLRQSRETMAGTLAHLFGDEDDLAAAMQRSHQVHTDAISATQGLTEATRSLSGPITTTSSGFSEASLSIAKAREELDKTGTVSRGTMGDLSNLGSRGVAGLDRDLTKTAETLRKAETELADTGTLSRRTARDLETLGSSGSGAGGGIGALLGALSGAGGGIGGFGLAAAVTIPVVIALGGDVIALGAALAPLAGLAGAAAVGISAAAQGFGVFKLATSGIADALKEQTTNTDQAAGAATTAASQQRAAAQSITSAMDGVRTAHEQVLSATQAVASAEDQAKTSRAGLTQAYTDARRALVDMSSSLEGAKTSEIGATQALADAQTALAALRAGADSQQLVEGAQQVTDALHSQQGALLAVGDAQTAYQTLVNGASSQQLVEGAQAVTNAVHSQQAAVLALTDAQNAYQTLIAGADAHTVAEGQQAVTNAQTGQESAAVALTKAQQRYAAVMGSATSSDLDKADALAQLHGAQNSVADAANRTIDAQAALDKLNAGPTDQDKAKALLAVQTAQDGVADSTNATADAQTALAKLQSPASIQDLAKAWLAIQQAQDGVADATNGTTDAQAALDKLNAPASAADMAKAILTVRKAQDGLVDATRDRERQQKAVDAADKAGVAGSAQVVAAHKAIEQADQQLGNARRQLADATLGVTRAEQGVANAQANAADSAAGATVAAGKLNQAFDALPAPAQAFVRQLISLKPKLDDLKATAAAGFFPGADEALASAARNFEPVKTVVAETGAALGELTAKAGELVGSKSFGKDIETVGGRNAEIIGTLGDAALDVGDAMRHVVVEAGPLTTWLAHTAAGWAQNADDAAEAGRESGRLAGFFDRTKDVLQQLGSIVSHTAGGLLGIGRAGEESGGQILHSIDTAATRFDEWSNSVDGQSSIKDFFNDARRLIANLVPALEGVGRATATLGLGPMSTALKLAGPYAEQLTYAFLAYKIVAGGVAVASGAATVALGLQNAALLLLRGASYDAAAGQWALNAAEDANPIGAIILGVAALAAGLIYAYEKVGWFHDGVDAVFNFIKDHWPLILGIITGPLGLLAVEVITHWNTIKTATTDAWNAVKDAVLTPVRAARDLLGEEVLPGISNRLGSAWEAIKTAATTAWTTLRDLILSPIRAARDLIGDEVLPGIANRLDGAWSAIKSGATTAWDAVKGTVLDALRGARDVLDSGENILGGIGDRISTAWSAITTNTKAFGLVIANVLARGFGNAANDVIGFVNAIIKAINLIPMVPNIGTIGTVKVPDALSLADATKSVQQNYRGGVVDVGGLVNKPIVMMGEEAPRHPEWVIPTNPAYRSRAQMLHAAAGKAIGLAQGGVLGQQEIADLWKAQGGNPARAGDMSWVAQAESGGNPLINNGGHVGRIAGGGTSIAAGLYQILGLPFTGDVYDAAVNTKMAISKSGNGANLHPWDASRSVWGSHVGGGGGGGGGGVLGAIGGAISGAVGAVGDAAKFIAKGPGAIIDLLPGTGDLPDWLKGTGSYVLDHVGDWIKDKVAGLLGGGGDGGSGGGGAPTNLTGVGKHLGDNAWVDSHTLAVTSYLDKMFSLTMSSGYRSPEHNAAIGGAPGSLHTHGSVGNPGATDSVGSLSAMNDYISFARSHVAGLKEAMVDNYAGLGNNAHIGFFARGGKFGGLPFGGSFADGGIVPGPLGAPAAIIAHGGERVTPARATSSSTPDPVALIAEALSKMNMSIYLGDREVTDIVRVEINNDNRAAAGAYNAGMGR